MRQDLSFSPGRAPRLLLIAPDPSMIKDSLKKFGATWTQATMSSIQELEARYRIHLFPTSLLLGPDGKVVLLDQDKMRGQNLLKTLDKILPP